MAKKVPTPGRRSAPPEMAATAHPESVAAPEAKASPEEGDRKVEVAPVKAPPAPAPPPPVEEPLNEVLWEVCKPRRIVKNGMVHNLAEGKQVRARHVSGLQAQGVVLKRVGNLG